MAKKKMVKRQLVVNKGRYKVIAETTQGETEFWVYEDGKIFASFDTEKAAYKYVMSIIDGR